MNSIKTILVPILLTLSLSAISTTTISAAPASSAVKQIDNTITHIETAIKAIDSNDFDAAQEHIKAARQSAKNIVGGSLEVKAQRGSSAITNARRLLQKSDAAGASASLKEALEVFKSLISSSEKSGRGGLK